jgi:hypothetical protein
MCAVRVPAPWSCSRMRPAPDGLVLPGVTNQQDAIVGGAALE